MDPNQFFINGNNYISKKNIELVKNVAQREYYEPGTFDDSNMTEFFTIKGERVRSKSELIIADELYRYNVPYHYEMPLELQNRGRTIMLRPDFTVIGRTSGSRYVYEHLGMMVEPSYVASSIRKLDLYERNGYMLGKNLILTHETKLSPLSVGVVDSYIENFFL